MGQLDHIRDALMGSFLADLEDLKPAIQLERLAMTVGMLQRLASKVDLEVLETGALELLRIEDEEHLACEPCREGQRHLSEYLLAKYQCAAKTAAERSKD